MDSKLSMTQSIQISIQKITSKEKGTQSAETSYVECSKLSKENVMSDNPATIVSKEETMIAKLMSILTMPKYKLTPCIPDMLNFTKEALSAVPDFTIEHKEHGMVVWDDPIDVRSLNIDKIVSFTLP